MWSVFDSLNSIVFVVNIDTHKLVYINPYGKNYLNIKDDASFLKHCENYSCSSLILNLTHKCDDCKSINDIKVGDFKSFSFYNKQLKNHFNIIVSILNYNNQRYRLEIATVKKDSEQSSIIKIISEQIIFNCLQIAYGLKHNSIHNTINHILEYLIPSLGVKRLMFMQIDSSNQIIKSFFDLSDDNKSISNIQQGEKCLFYQTMLNSFITGELVFFEDLDFFKEQMPITYTTYMLYKHKKLFILPILDNHNIVGFLFICDPNEEKINSIWHIAPPLGHFFSSLISAQELQNKYYSLSLYDQLTGALNRHALYDNIQNEKYDNLNSCGVIYLDIVGLKNINDSLGHQQGDQLIVKTFKNIENIFYQHQIYRIGGDEFVVICSNISNERFINKVASLKKSLLLDNCTVSLGYKFCDKNINIISLIKDTDLLMYEDKRKFYASMLSSSNRANSENNIVDNSKFINISNNELINNYLQHNQFNFQNFLSSLSMGQLPFGIFWGDLHKNVFYIADSIKNLFNFKENIVFDFFTFLNSNIVSKEQSKIFSNRVKQVLQGDNEILDFKMKIIDPFMKTWWLCIYAKCSANDKKKPSFISGALYLQDIDLSYDQITKLPRLNVLQSYVLELIYSKQKFALLAISFGYHKRIKDVYGDQKSNETFIKLTQSIIGKFYPHISLFRVEDNTLVALFYNIDPIVEQSLVSYIKILSKDVYTDLALPINDCVGFSLAHYPNIIKNPNELINKLIINSNLAQVNGFEIIELDKNENNIQYNRNILDEIKDAVDKFYLGFKLIIQPVYFKQDNSFKLKGYETFLNFNKYENILLNNNLIKTIEQSTLVESINYWFIEQTIKFQVNQRKFAGDLKIGISLSLVLLLNEDFVDRLESLINKYKINPQSLVLEISELSSFYNNINIKNIFNRLKKLKVLICVSNYGIKHITLETIKDPIISYIKTDKVLCSDKHNKDDAFHVLKCIIFACNEFKKLVCVSGISNKKTFEIAEKYGANLFQGDYLSKPMDEVNLLHFLLNNKHYYN